MISTGRTRRGWILLIGLLWYGCSGSTGTAPDPIAPPPDEEPPAALTDEELMDRVQEQTFAYFWEYAEPNSGMARERSDGSSTLVATGGSGFGLAAFPVAVERGWITGQQALDRLDKVLSFLESVPTYHGAFSHWYDGATEQTVPFSEQDDGGDLVETALLMQGLLINRQYFDADTELQRQMRARITALWEAVEWDWYTQGQQVLYWHWSPEHRFAIGLQIRGYNEALITYVLAAAAPQHDIDPEVYRQGWARDGAILNGEQYYEVTLPVGPELGGPLFLSQYSFIGLDPTGLSDAYADYGEQAEAHARINYRYCLDNPLDYRGYGAQVWGLTASDGPDGYAAHSPTRDLGVIAPTAAVSSIAFTPEASLEAMHFFYSELGDRLWGAYGFYDAFSLQEQWFSGNYLAIDQGPIITMIENYRTGQPWELFMNDPDVEQGLRELGFSSPHIEAQPMIITYN